MAATPGTGPDAPISNQVDQFFKANYGVDQQKMVQSGTGLALMLGSFMFPGIAGAGGPRNWRPSNEFLRIIGKPKTRVLKFAEKSKEILKRRQAQMEHDFPAARDELFGTPPAETPRLDIKQIKEITGLKESKLPKPARVKRHEELLTPKEAGFAEPPSKVTSMRTEAEFLEAEMGLRELIKDPEFIKEFGLTPKQPGFAEPPVKLKPKDIFKTEYGDVMYDGTMSGLDWYTFHSGQAKKGTFATKAGVPREEMMKVAKETFKRFPVKDPQGTVKPVTKEFNKRDTRHPDRFDVLSPPKKYQVTEGTTSPQIKSPTTPKGTQGKGLGYGIDRKLMEPPTTKMSDDPAEYLLQRVFNIHKKLTPKERITYGVPDRMDLFERWERYVLEGRKDKVPSDVWEMFRRMLEE